MTARRGTGFMKFSCKSVSCLEFMYLFFYFTKKEKAQGQKQISAKSSLITANLSVALLCLDWEEIGSLWLKGLENFICRSRAPHGQDKEKVGERVHSHVSRTSAAKNKVNKLKPCRNYCIVYLFAADTKEGKYNRKVKAMHDNIRKNSLTSSIYKSEMNTKEDDTLL